MRKIGRWMVMSLACTALVIGMVAMSSKTEAAPGCICPIVYAPVKCSNGKTYSNLCIARCNHASGCVPVIILPPPV